MAGPRWRGLAPNHLSSAQLAGGLVGAWRRPIRAWMCGGGVAIGLGLPFRGHGRAHGQDALGMGVRGTLSARPQPTRIVPSL